MAGVPSLPGGPSATFPVALVRTPVPARAS
ncbi:hypothetical protein FHU37_001527 [Allostreptomyces psammosilenae]|uniref:Uncharacterized protein n=1 Tax=Allostreptomyces psammosilenae TaxID=1892865 RepID=A0A852ZUY2_9ACTN|nr:hypothetical protein [Allostreptomyces psammosilenae]